MQYYKYYTNLTHAVCVDNTDNVQNLSYRNH
jgi:hypothetical protein